MTAINAMARNMLLVGMLALVAGGCERAAQEGAKEAEARSEVTAAGGSGAEAVTADSTATVARTDAPAAVGFDLAAVPVSTATLGEFPYFTLPAGYGNPNRPVPVRDFDRVAVWTGDRLEWIEGRIFESIVHAERGKGWSKLEVIRNLGHQVAQAGGVEVTQSKPPQEAVKAWSEGQEYSPGRGDIYNNDVATWLVRRSDRDIWLHFSGDTASGSWMVIESAAFEPTSNLLPAAELRQQLDADGRVAIQVNFEVDKAEILADSRPQLEQVLVLLRDDAALRLSIDGHTDATGDAKHNQRLSEARARSVLAALVAEGIEASRLEAKGHGQAQPVASNDSDAGRASNRRVELVRLG